MRAQVQGMINRVLEGADPNRVISTCITEALNAKELQGEINKLHDLQRRAVQTNQERKRIQDELHRLITLQTKLKQSEMVRDPHFRDFVKDLEAFEKSPDKAGLLNKVDKSHEYLRDHYDIEPEEILGSKYKRAFDLLWSYFDKR